MATTKSTPALFDLSKNNVSAAAESGYEFELLMPGTNEPTGAFITVRGEQSPVVKQYDKRRYNEYMLALNQAKRRGKEYEPTIEESLEKAVESAVNRIIGWRNIADEGKEVPFTKEAATKILTDHSWIREAVVETSMDLLNFDPKKLKN